MVASYQTSGGRGQRRHPFKVNSANSGGRAPKILLVLYKMLNERAEKVILRILAGQQFIICLRLCSGSREQRKRTHLTANLRAVWSRRSLLRPRNRD